MKVYINMVSSQVYLFGFSNDERPEDPEADPDYVPPETESKTSWSDDSELSDVVDDVSLVTDSPPRSDNDDLEVTAIYGRDDVPSGMFHMYCNM